jgi:hypothetical protein
VDIINNFKLATRHTKAILKNEAVYLETNSHFRRNTVRSIFIWILRNAYSIILMYEGLTETVPKEWTEPALTVTVQISKRINNTLRQLT